MSLIRTVALVGLSLGALTMAATQVAAQKSKDTLRIAYDDPISGIDIIHDPKGETNLTMWAVFDRLVRWDPRAQKLIPGLAESWKRIGKKAIEFKLKKGIKWHDGQDFDADDVVYTINWLSNKKTRFRAKSRAAFLKNAEKIDRYTVRINTKRPFAMAYLRLAVSLPVLPEHAHSKFKKKVGFARKPIGTGPYKAVSIDPSKGVVLVKNPDYRHGNAASPAAGFKRIEIYPVPDPQTRVAKLITGEVDVITDIPADQAQQLAAAPNIGVTPNNALHYIYLALDAKNRSGIKHLSDIKVRKAVFQAIDREAIRKSLVHPQAKPMAAMCLKGQIGCSHSVPALGYDPKKAKALLAQAGMAGGFDVTITTFRVLRDVAEAVSGYLRKVGIRAKVKSVPFPTYRKLQHQGKLNMLLAQYSMGGIPDVGVMTSFYFSSKSRDMYGSKLATSLNKKSNAEFNPKKRGDLQRQILDEINAKALLLPISTRPIVYAHSKTVAIRTGSISSYGADIHDFSWVK